MLKNMKCLKTCLWFLTYNNLYQHIIKIGQYYNSIIKMAHLDVTSLIKTRKFSHLLKITGSHTSSKYFRNNQIGSLIRKKFPSLFFRLESSIFCLVVYSIIFWLYFLFHLRNYVNCSENMVFMFMCPFQLALQKVEATNNVEGMQNWDWESTFPSSCNYYVELTIQSFFLLEKAKLN